MFLIYTYLIFLGALEGIFARLHATEDENTSEEVLALIRERLLKFLVVKLKQHGELEKDVEDYIMQECKKVAIQTSICF